MKSGPEAVTTVLVAWDLKSGRQRESLVRFAVTPPAGYGATVPGLGEESLDTIGLYLRGCRVADLVLVVGSGDDPIFVGFLLGVASGSGVPVIAVAFAPTDALMFAALNFPFVLVDGPEAMWQRVCDAVPSPPPAWPPPPTSPPPPHGVRLLAPDDVRSALSESIVAHPSEPNHVAAALTSVERPLSVVWVLTPYVYDWKAGAWSGLAPNLRNAVAAGEFLAGRLLDPDYEPSALVLVRADETTPVYWLRGFERPYTDIDSLAVILRQVMFPAAANEPFVLERLELVNFKCFERLTVDLSAASSLAGDWTCIAGINGAGKTSILQAICLVLLGRHRALQLGAERLRSFLRRGADGRGANASIRASIRRGGRVHDLVLEMGESDLANDRFSPVAGYAEMDGVWEALKSQVYVSYGATRNISEHRDTRFASLGRDVQRQMTLFDPLTQIARAEVLLEGGRANQGVLSTLTRLLERVLKDIASEIAVEVDAEAGSIRFRRGGAPLRATELPDGFRSAVAWLADLCAAWHEVSAPEAIGDGDPLRIRGIVLIDEIDLHLHARLQRSLVQRLRENLPDVQWIVTTHSPLILASFDRNELVLLDAEVEGGVRPLDRQILGFSSDQVYEWLMGTSPHSTVIEQKLRFPTDLDTAELLYQATGLSEDEAREALGKRRDKVERWRREREGA